MQLDLPSRHQHPRCFHYFIIIHNWSSIHAGLYRSLLLYQWGLFDSRSRSLQWKIYLNSLTVLNHSKTHTPTQWSVFIWTTLLKNSSRLCLKWYCLQKRISCKSISMYQWYVHVARNYYSLKSVIMNCLSTIEQWCRQVMFLESKYLAWSWRQRQQRSSKYVTYFVCIIKVVRWCVCLQFLCLSVHTQARYGSVFVYYCCNCLMICNWSPCKDTM